jgi:hypothetical protein
MWLQSTYYGAAAAGSLNRQAKQGDRPGHVCVGKLRREKEERRGRWKEEGAVDWVVKGRRAVFASAVNLQYLSSEEKWCGACRSGCGGGSVLCRMQLT